MGHWGKVLALAGVYAAAGRLGFLAAVAPGNVTVVWPPSGIALAALLLWGRSLWPGIALGSAAINLWFFLDSGVAPLSALLAAAAIALGSTVQALAAARFIARRAPAMFAEPRETFWFTAIATAACLIASTAGPLALWGLGLAERGTLLKLWSTWWLGDLSGILLFTPALLAWGRPARRGAADLRERVLFALALLVVAPVVFGAGGLRGAAFSFYLTPLVVWAGFRLGARGVSLALLALGGVGILGTALGGGPFSRLDVRGALFQLQAYLFLSSMTGLLIAATVEKAALQAEALRRAQGEESRVIHERDKVRREFLANISHELRTPIASVIGFAETLLRGGLDDADNRREFVERIHGNARWLARLVEDLLDLASLESGRSVPILEPVSVAGVARKAVAAVSELAERRKVSVELAGLTGFRVVADPTHLQRVLQNLVDNGIKYNKEGGRVRVEAQPAGSRGVAIAVWDDGPGISPEDLPHLFERFQRASAARDRKIAGTGLGLALVKELVESNAGTIRVESAAGQGTRFVIELPRARD